MIRIAGAGVLCALLAGCSSGGVTTGSVAGAGAPDAPPPPVNDVTSRAMQVGSVSARAQKCGYNFDPAKLKSNFLAAEGKLNPADVAKANQIYDVAHNGVMKAVAAKADYCSETKTATIKEDLTRHLAGDYSPRPPKIEKPEPGLFDNWGDGNTKADGFGGEDWWSKQQDKAGK